MMCFYQEHSHLVKIAFSFMALITFLRDFAPKKCASCQNIAREYPLGSGDFFDKTTIQERCVKTN